MKKLWLKYKSFVLYVIFGVFTTIVNIVCYRLCKEIGGKSTFFSNTFAWIMAVLFAYLTNRKWVFGSEAHKFHEIVREIGTFFGCRLATGILDMIFMIVSVDILHGNDTLMKVISNIIVILLNYMFSKIVIFRKRQIE